MAVIYEESKKYEFNGESLTLVELAIKYNTTPMTIYMRLRRGANIYQAVWLKRRAILFSEQEKKMPKPAYMNRELMEKRKIFNLVYGRKQKSEKL